MSELAVERRRQLDQPPLRTSRGGQVLVTPPISEEYWAYRVKLSGGQAIVGFPKFLTIGIGFAQEEDWNTNLPYTSSAESIFAHVAHNKGDDTIRDEDCIAAIRLIQVAVAEDLNV